MVDWLNCHMLAAAAHRFSIILYCYSNWVVVFNFWALQFFNFWALQCHKYSCYILCMKNVYTNVTIIMGWKLYDFHCSIKSTKHLIVINVHYENRLKELSLTSFESQRALCWGKGF